MRRLRSILCVFLLAAIGCRITDVELWSTNKPPPDAHAFREVPNIAYCDGPDADKVRHRLDLYVPESPHERGIATKNHYPVVVLVHGGAWMVGDNRCCGLYTSIAKQLASQGFVVASINYRLSPQVKHPEHIKDVARAVAWVQRNIDAHNGDREKIFLMGHSAGGHLVSLLATDTSYLADAGGDVRKIRGVVSVSGVYRIEPGSVDVTLGGKGPLAVRMGSMVPIRGDSKKDWVHLTDGGIPMKINIFGPPFGDDPLEREAASPINHVRPGLPPFLLFSADHDLPILGGQASDFHEALARAAGTNPVEGRVRVRGGDDLDAARANLGAASQWVRVHNRNHNSIMFSASNADDPVASLSVAFIRKIAGSAP